MLLAIAEHASIALKHVLPARRPPSDHHTSPPALFALDQSADSLFSFGSLLQLHCYARVCMHTMSNEQKNIHFLVPSNEALLETREVVERG